MNKQIWIGLALGLWLLICGCTLVGAKQVADLKRQVRGLEAQTLELEERLGAAQTDWERGWESIPTQVTNMEQFEQWWQEVTEGRCRTRKSGNRMVILVNGEFDLGAKALEFEKVAPNWLLTDLSWTRLNQGQQGRWRFVLMSARD